MINYSTKVNGSRLKDNNQVFFSINTIPHHLIIIKIFNDVKLMMMRYLLEGVFRLQVGYNKLINDGSN